MVARLDREREAVPDARPRDPAGSGGVRHPTTTRHPSRQPGTSSAVRCRARCAAVGRRRCSTWPAGHPRAIGVQRLAAPLTGTRAAVFRAGLWTLIGRPEQLARRAASRPAVGHHPTGQLRTGGQHDRRCDRWRSLGEQHPHLSNVAVTHPAQQLCGRQRVRVEPGPRVAGVRAERLRPRRLRPAPQPGIPGSPAPTTPTRRPSLNCCGRTAGPRTAAAHPPDTRPRRPPGPSVPPGSGRPARPPATSASPTPPQP